MSWVLYEQFLPVDIIGTMAVFNDNVCGVCIPLLGGVVNRLGKVHDD